MYCFHESDPDYLPPPVYFYPPNAPPISAPDGPMFTFTIPQSDPSGPVHLNAFPMSWVKRLLLNPWGTLLLISIAYSSVLNLITNKMGQKYSYLIIYESPLTSTIVGSTKYPFPSILLPPYNILASFYFLIFYKAWSKICKDKVEWSGPHNTPFSSGSPILTVL